MKYPIGFKFSGLDPHHMKSKYLIECEIVGHSVYGDKEYRIEWKGHELNPDPELGEKTGVWDTTEKYITEYILGFELFHSPLYKSLKEDHEL